MSFLGSSKLSTSFSRSPRLSLKGFASRRMRIPLMSQVWALFFFTFSLFFLFFLGLWAFMVLLNFRSWAFFCQDPCSFFAFHGMGFIVKFWSLTTLCFNLRYTPKFDCLLNLYIVSFMNIMSLLGKIHSKKYHLLF